MVGVAQSSKATSHIQRTHFPHFDALSLSLLTVFPQSGNVKIFSEKQGVSRKKGGFGGGGGAWKCDATQAASVGR